MTTEWFWDLYARRYDDLRHLIPYKELAQEVVEAVSIVGARASILDVGCGTGYTMGRLMEVHPEIRAVGIDRSPAMLAVARRRIDPHRVRLVRSNLDLAFPFDDAVFDGAMCVNALYAMSSPDAMLAEIYRVLKPGAPLVLVNPWKPEQRHIWIAHFRCVMRARDLTGIMRTIWHASSFAAIIAVNAVIARKARLRTFWFLPPKELRAHLERSGFAVTFLRDDAYAGTCCLALARKREEGLGSGGLRVG